MRLRNHAGAAPDERSGRRGDGGRLWTRNAVHGGLIYAGLSRQGHDVAHAGVPCAIHGGSFVDDAAELAAAGGSGRRSTAQDPAGAVAYVPQPCLPLGAVVQARVERALQPLHGAGGRRGRRRVPWRDAAGRRAAVAVIR